MTSAATRSRVIPSLRYRDPLAAIDWLCQVLGFERHLVVPDDRGGIVHAQLTLGGGMVMLGASDATGPWGELLAAADAVPRGTHCLCLVVDDVAALHAKVQQQGGSVVDPLAARDYGGSGFGFRDPQGQLWWAGDYDPWA